MSTHLSPTPTRSQLLGSSNAPTPTTSRPGSPATNPSQPTHDSAGNLLPGILCLHGGGSNSTVFKIQSRRLLWNLQSQFRFVFAQGPLEGTPGFGMLPVFSSCAPFYRWVERRFVLGEADTEQTPAEEVARLDELLFRVMEENGGVESFVGVMGFSQGARMVPGLLLRQKVEEQRKLGGSRWKLKFGVMVGGPYPPIGLYDGVKKEDYELLRTVPTVHAWGSEDHVKSGCVELWKLCDGDECFQMEFGGGHHMPLKDGEARDLCDLIRGAYYAGGGTLAIGDTESY